MLRRAQNGMSNFVREVRVHKFWHFAGGQIPQNSRVLVLLVKGEHRSQQFYW